MKKNQEIRRSDQGGQDQAHNCQQTIRQQDADVLFLLICVPFMLISLILLAVKVKETKGVDLDNIRVDE